jgi:hypothetical protein
MSYRPITDIWILARPKVAYYGAYPNGFLERAKALLGGSRTVTLHVCGGHAKKYPNRKLVERDYTLDLDSATAPDYHADAREPFPEYTVCDKWPAILLDPPYTEVDAEKYAPGVAMFPSANQLLGHALRAVAVGGKVGMLHYILPQPPRENVKFVACIGVIVGYNNRMRCFSVFERLA